MKTSQERETKEEFITNWFLWLKRRMPTTSLFWAKQALTQIFEEGYNRGLEASESRVKELEYGNSLLPDAIEQNRLYGIKIKELEEEVKRLKALFFHCWDVSENSLISYCRGEEGHCNMGKCEKVITYEDWANENNIL